LSAVYDGGTMHRFFAKPENEDSVIIKGEDAKHISKVLRLEVGDNIIVCDGKGMDYICKIERIGKDEVQAVVNEKIQNAAEPQTRITLYQGIPKAGKIEYIIQKCTELGAACFVPVSFNRCVAKMDNDSKVERLNKVALEASKQSGRGIVPIVSKQISFFELLRVLPSHGAIIVPYESEENLSLKDALKDVNSKDIALIIGPEGGFEKEEIDALSDIGAKIVTLGKRILRTETAGMATIAMIMYDKDEIQ